MWYFYKNFLQLIRQIEMESTEKSDERKNFLAVSTAKL